jgi:hypothetical protein
MAFQSKKAKTIATAVDREKLYGVDEAIALSKLGKGSLCSTIVTADSSIASPGWRRPWGASWGAAS